MPAWQRMAAEATHVLLYLLMFAVPLSGWLMSSAKGFQTVWFGVLPLPDLLDKNKELGDLLKEVHEALNFGMAGLVLAHAGAALKHHFIDRDDVLARMLPFLAKTDPEIPMNLHPTQPCPLRAGRRPCRPGHRVQPVPAGAELPQSFVSKQMNVPVDGKFTSFRSKLAFDPARPAAAKAEFEIDLASIDAGSKDANDEVAGKAWFNTKAFPVAKFVATTVKPLGNNRFEVAGKMSIKGKTLDLVTPVTVSQQGNSASFDGSLVLKRADYGIGDGIWADFGTVANEIQIKFRSWPAPQIIPSPHPGETHEKALFSSPPFPPFPPPPSPRRKPSTSSRTHTYPRFEYSHFGYSNQQQRFDKTSGKIVLDRAAKTDRSM
jgi:polyisoprenoid-binding protein YceI